MPNCLSFVCLLLSFDLHETSANFWYLGLTISAVSSLNGEGKVRLLTFYTNVCFATFVCKRRAFVDFVCLFTLRSVNYVFAYFCYCFCLNEKRSIGLEGSDLNQNKTKLSISS